MMHKQETEYHTLGNGEYLHFRLGFETWSNQAILGALESSEHARYDERDLIKRKGERNSRQDGLEFNSHNISQIS